MKCANATYSWASTSNCARQSFLGLSLTSVLVIFPIILDGFTRYDKIKIERLYDGVLLPKQKKRVMTVVTTRFQARRT
jgi:hypothetical protein